MKPRALVACEESGRVRDALIKRGFDAVSCDLLPTRSPGPHYQGDVRDILNDGWDLMIAHPPCTYLSSSGLHWNRNPKSERFGGVQTEEALAFAQLLLDAPIHYIALENPIGCISTRIRPPDQTIQPWMFGDDASKATCFWLKNLPPLTLSLLKSSSRHAWSFIKVSGSCGGRTKPTAGRIALVRRKTAPCCAALPIKVSPTPWRSTGATWCCSTAAPTYSRSDTAI